MRFWLDFAFLHESSPHRAPATASGGIPTPCASDAGMSPNGRCFGA
jgi:hypothetical protein